MRILESNSKIPLVIGVGIVDILLNTSNKKGYNMRERYDAN